MTLLMYIITTMKTRPADDEDRDKPSQNGRINFRQGLRQ